MILPLTAGSDKMAQTDPHGWILTAISVGVVFTALIVLFFVYKFIGNASSGKYSRKSKGSAATATPDAETAAAIALALSYETGADGATAAAIALALHLHCDSGVHDRESGIITIRHQASNWDNKSRNFRTLPRK